jgi:hypothetical protein
LGVDKTVVNSEGTVFEMLDLVMRYQPFIFAVLVAFNYQGASL